MSDHRTGAAIHGGLADVLSGDRLGELVRALCVVALDANLWELWCLSQLCCHLQPDAMMHSTGLAATMH